MYLKDRIPELGDTVKSKISPDYIGVVIAKYQFVMCDNQPWPWYIDVRLSDDTVKYQLEMAKWEVVRLNDDQE